MEKSRQDVVSKYLWGKFPRKFQKSLLFDIQILKIGSIVNSGGLRVNIFIGEGKCKNTAIVLSSDNLNSCQSL